MPASPDPSARELAVLRAVADHGSNAAAGRVLHLSQHTVKTHMSRLLTKTGCYDRAQLMALAFRKGWIS